MDHMTHRTINDACVTIKDTHRITNGHVWAELNGKINISGVNNFEVLSD